MRLSMRLASCATAVVVSAAHPSTLWAQVRNAPKLTLTEEWRIDPRKNGFDAVNNIAIAPDGRVIMIPMSYVAPGPVVAFDSTGTKELWRLPTGRGDNFEIRFADRVGWTGTQMWIADRGYDHVVLVDAAGKVTKSIENPEFVRPPLNDRHKFPFFGAMDPLARFADGSMLVRPYADEGFFETRGFDTTSVHVLQVSKAGIIQKSIATYPPDEYVAFSRAKGNAFLRFVPMQSRTFLAVSTTGTRLLLVSAPSSGKDSATIRVTVLNERGETIASKRHPVTTVEIPKKVRDSVIARTTAVPEHAIQEVRAAVGKRLPGVYPTVTSAVIGNDGSIWIGMRAATGDTVSVPWLILDAQGGIVGTVTTPRRVAIVAADATHAWAVERSRTSAAAVMRYKLTVPAKR